MQEIDYAPTNIEVIGKELKCIENVVFKEIQEDIDKQRKNDGKDQLFYKTDVKIPQRFFFGDEDMHEIRIDDDIAEKILEDMKQRLTDDGVQYFNSSVSVNFTDSQVEFKFSITQYVLKEEELKQLEKECKRNDDCIYYCLLSFILVLFLIVLFIDTIDNIDNAQLYTAIAMSPFLVPIILSLILNHVTPVKWRLRKKYIANKN